MKLESLTLRELRMPLVNFFETSFGRTYERRVMLVTVHCAGGLEGWAECVAGEAPSYSEEWVDGAWDLISRHIAPMVLRREIACGREVPAMLARIRGNRMAKAAVENAVWDAEAIEKNVSLWKLLGETQNPTLRSHPSDPADRRGPGSAKDGAPCERREIACGVSIGIQNSVEQLLETIATELAAGYQRIKVKVKPGWDVDVLRRVRQQWPDILLSCDANSAYTLNDVEHLKRFDEFNLLMIEQPLWNDDIYFHAELQKQLKTSICLDESIHHQRDAQTAAELGSCQTVNIKVGRVGGFSSAIDVHDVCKANNIANWCGGMLESGIGRAHNVALSTLPNFTLPGDVSASKRYWKEDIVEPEIEVTAQGTIVVPTSAGRGYKLREELIQKLTIRKVTI
jgi:o-succinylbenzoate synthase